MKRSHPSPHHPEARARGGALAPQDDGAGDRQRIDKWLWHARMVRTRRDAAALVEAGHARLNGRRVTAPGHALRLGDVVTLALDRTVRVVAVAGFCERRGAADEAKSTYRDLTPRPATKACAFSGIARKFRPA